MNMKSFLQIFIAIYSVASKSTRFKPPHDKPDPLVVYIKLKKILEYTIDQCEANGRSLFSHPSVSKITLSTAHTDDFVHLADAASNKVNDLFRFIKGNADAIFPRDDVRANIVHAINVAIGDYNILHKLTPKPFAPIAYEIIGNRKSKLNEDEYNEYYAEIETDKKLTKQKIYLDFLNKMAKLLEKIDISKKSLTTDTPKPSADGAAAATNPVNDIKTPDQIAQEEKEKKEKEEKEKKEKEEKEKEEKEKKAKDAAAATTSSTSTASTTQPEKGFIRRNALPIAIGAGVVVLIAAGAAFYFLAYK